MIYNPFAKPKIVKSKEYMNFIKSIPCLISDRQATNHHENFGQGTTGGKCSDLWCLPLSSEWHTDNTYSRHRHPGGWEAFWADHNINPWLKCIEFINYFFSNGGKL